MKKIQSLLILSVFSFILFSCKKDDKEVNETCRVSKIDVFDAGNIAFSANYIYQNNRVTRIEIPGTLNYEFEYSGERISKRNFMQSGSTSVIYSDHIFYNADGTISKIDRFMISGSNQVKDMSYVFTYDNGKISKVVVSELNSSNILEISEEHSFIFTGSNITAITAKYFDSGPTSTVTLTYNYDTNKNYFTAMNNQFLLVDPFFIDFDVSFFPLIFSANNIKDVKAPSNTVAFAYNLDNKGNLSNYLIGGQKVAGYTYNCQ